MWVVLVLFNKNNIQDQQAVQPVLSQDSLFYLSLSCTRLLGVNTSTWMRWCIVENSRHSRPLFLSRRITADCVYGIMSDLADKEDREGDRERKKIEKIDETRRGKWIKRIKRKRDEEGSIGRDSEREREKEERQRSMLLRCNAATYYCYFLPLSRMCMPKRTFAELSSTRNGIPVDVCRSLRRSRVGWLAGWLAGVWVTEEDAPGRGVWVAVRYERR